MHRRCVLLLWARVLALGLPGVNLLAACEQESPAEQNVLSGLRVAQVLGGEGGEYGNRTGSDHGFAKADRARSFSFPADHGAHAAYRSEWWYITAVMSDGQGQEYGLQYTLFRQGLGADTVTASPWSTGQAYLAHFALTDVARQDHRAAQRFTRGHPAGVRVQAEPFGARILDWSLEQTSAEPWSLMLKAGDNEQDIAARLTLVQTRDIVLQGEQGLSRKGEDQASYYYSVPRMALKGELQIGDRKTQVTGQAWLDREWSTSVLGPHLVGWDWFALQLERGEDLMMFQLRRRDGGRDAFDHGSLRRADGEKLDLAHSDYRLVPRRFWRDPDGVAWPVEWQIEGPLKDLLTGRPSDPDIPLIVRALVDDQRMNLGLVYWEGLVEVVYNNQRLGRGYLEMTGYTRD